MSTTGRLVYPFRCLPSAVSCRWLAGSLLLLYINQTYSWKYTVLNKLISLKKVLNGHTKLLSSFTIHTFQIPVYSHLLQYLEEIWPGHPRDAIRSHCLTYSHHSLALPCSAVTFNNAGYADRLCHQKSNAASVTKTLHKCTVTSYYRRGRNVDVGWGVCSVVHTLMRERSVVCMQFNQFIHWSVTSGVIHSMQRRVGYHRPTAWSSVLARLTLAICLQ